MQAPLSSIASGKQFRTKTIPAVLPCFSNEELYEPIAEGAGLAHDAGNLLGALGLYCELLALPGVLREEHRHYADELQMLSMRSQVLIDRLVHARLLHPASAARSTPEPTENVSVPEVIERCRGVLDAIARRAVEVAYGAGAALPVVVSREALERILINLTKNAAAACDRRKGGAHAGAVRLRVSCQRAGIAVGSSDRIVLTVEDTGCGMSSAAVQVLLGEGIAQHGAHGIGFRVVRELVGASGGRLRLWSRCEAGPDTAAVGASGTTVEISWAVAGMVDEGEVHAFEQRRRLMESARRGAVAGSLRGRASC